MRNQIFEKIFDLKDKVGIVTGGSSGIGLAIARTLGYAGVKVAVVNRTAAAGEVLAYLQKRLVLAMCSSS